MCKCYMAVNSSDINIYRYITISINFIDHICKLRLRGILSERSHYYTKFFGGDCAVSIFIKQTKCFFEFWNSIIKLRTIYIYNAMKIIYHSRVEKTVYNSRNIFLKKNKTNTLKISDQIKSSRNKG